jgi:outer membrane lipoprotein-sorting protein
LKPFLHIVFVIFLLIPPTCVAGERIIEGAEAEQLLERIQESQASLKTISGLFIEERTISTMPVPLVFKGRVYAEPPGFLFLAYEEPIQHIMKVSGKRVIFYVAEAATADEVDMQTMGEGDGPPDLFTWSPAEFKGEIVETATGYVLQNPDMQAGDRQIRITLDKQTLMIQALRLQEPGGDITTIIMQDLQVNTAIPAAILNYELPPGVIIHKMGK